MAKIETFRARKGLSLKAAPAVAAGYTIEVRFMGGLTATQKEAFKKAAKRWTTAITGDLPDVNVDGETISNLLILAQGDTIDGPGMILGQAGPTRLRPANAGAAAFLPAKGRMTFDKADLAKMEANGSLVDVITHEMGHVIGIGTIWTKKGFLKGPSTNNPTFTGPNAMKEYGKLRGSNQPKEVPVENTGGPGTRNGHWRDLVFGKELMTGFVVGGGNPLSRMTIASLKDLGYTVNLAAAEPYVLPTNIELAEFGITAEAVGEPEGIVLPSIPMVLPNDSLNV